MNAQGQVEKEGGISFAQEFDLALTDVAQLVKVRPVTERLRI